MTCRRLFSPTMWDLGMECRTLGLNISFLFSLHKTAELTAHGCHHVLQYHITSAKLHFSKKVIALKDGHLDLDS